MAKWKVGCVHMVIICTIGMIFLSKSFSLPSSTDSMRQLSRIWTSIPRTRCRHWTKKLTFTKYRLSRVRAYLHNQSSSMGSKTSAEKIIFEHFFRLFSKFQKTKDFYKSPKKPWKFSKNFLTSKFRLHPGYSGRSHFRNGEDGADSCHVLEQKPETETKCTCNP